VFIDRDINCDVLFNNEKGKAPALAPQKGNYARYYLGKSADRLAGFCLTRPRKNFNGIQTHVARDYLSRQLSLLALQRGTLATALMNLDN